MMEPHELKSSTGLRSTNVAPMHFGRSPTHDRCRPSQSSMDLHGSSSPSGAERSSRVGKIKRYRPAQAGRSEIGGVPGCRH
jgi:hypothetical protein